MIPLCSATYECKMSDADLRVWRLAPPNRWADEVGARIPSQLLLLFGSNQAGDEDLFKDVVRFAPVWKRYDAPCLGSNLRWKCLKEQLVAAALANRAIDVKLALKLDKPQFGTFCQESW